MKCVLDTSPIVWLSKAGRLDLVSKVYDALYTSPSVKHELNAFSLPSDFIDELIIPNEIEEEPNRFNRLVRRWKRKLDLQDTADVEVYVTYALYSNADEMLFANKEAEQKLKRRGAKVRDIADLYELAEERGIFSRDDSFEYLTTLLKIEFRTPYVKGLIERLSV